MHVVSRKALAEFGHQHRDAVDSLEVWYRATRHAKWSNREAVRQSFPDADPVGKCWVFNFCHNDYRLIVKINFRTHSVFVRYILTHKEYDRDVWKKDCY